MAQELTRLSRLAVIQGFLDRLSGEIEALTVSALSAHLAATHEESKAEDRHDTFAIEASYLAAGQSARILDLENLKAELESYLSGVPKRLKVGLGSLVAYESEGGECLVLMTRVGGGLKVVVEGVPIQILTEQSPLGSGLFDLEVGDGFEVEIRGKVRTYSIRSID
jgi:transcription elongation GreA/GreB family factor